MPLPYSRLLRTSPDAPEKLDEFHEIPSDELNIVSPLTAQKKLLRYFHVDGGLCFFLYGNCLWHF